MSGDNTQRDLEPTLHVVTAMALILATGSAHLFGLFDVDGVGVMSLLFPALLFLAGQPRGRQAWRIAGSAVFLILAVVAAGSPVLHELFGDTSGPNLVPNLAALVILGTAVGLVRTRSTPPPAHSPTNPDACKPLTGWAFIPGVALGLVVFAVALPLWRHWLENYPEIEVVALAIAILLAGLACGLAVVTAIGCRATDARQAVLGVLAGIAVAATTTICILGGTELSLFLVPERRILSAMVDVMIFSAALVAPMIYVANWGLGQRPIPPSHPPEREA